MKNIFRPIQQIFEVEKFPILINLCIKKGNKIHFWSVDCTQLPGRLFSPCDICKKLSHHFLLHFPIGMGSYDHHAKYQGVFP